MNRLGDSGVNRLGDTPAFGTPAGQLLLPGRVRPRMYTIRTKKIVRYKRVGE